MNTSESNHGLSLILNSNASKDTYIENLPCYFTNILKQPIKLDQHAEYEVCLSNIHSPSEEVLVLKKNDSGINDIKFNLGMFIYDSVKSEWKLLDRSRIPLWTYTPNNDLHGVEIDSFDTRRNFITRFLDSLKLSNHSAVKRQCLKMFQICLMHVYDKSHTGPSFALECEKCEPYLANINLLYDTDNVLEVPEIDILEEFDNTMKEHIWFKSLQKLAPNDKYIFFDLLLKCLRIDLYQYMSEVLHACMSHRSKNAVNRLFKRIKDKNGKSVENLADLYKHDIFKRLWDNVTESSREMPVMALFVDFGYGIAKFFSIDKNTNLFIASCGENIRNTFNSNVILSPKFCKQKIDSLFVYSDLVKKTVRVGDALTNLLGIISINKSIYNKPNPMNIFRPISHNFVQSVSVIITDQNGDRPQFDKNSYVTLEIFIRKR